METIEHMLMAHACQQVVLRTAACADANDADQLSALFTEQAVLVRPGAEPLHGREAIRQAYAQRPAERITRHLVSNLLVDVAADRRVRVRSSVLLWSGSRADADGPFGRPAHARHLVGEFDDMLTCNVSGTWLIERREARFALHRGDQAC